MTEPLSLDTILNDFDPNDEVWVLQCPEIVNI